MNKNNELKSLYPKDGGLSFVMMMALYVFITFFGQAILTALSVPSGNVVTIAVSSTFSILAIIFTLCYFAFVKECGVKVVSEFNAFKLDSVGLLILLSVGMFLGLGFLNTVFINLFKSLGVAVGGLTITFTGVGDLFTYIFTLAILPAVFEELFFRALMLNALKSVGKTVSVIIAGLLFALYHCSVAQLLYQFVYGVALSVLFLYAKSVVPCIIAHFINNFTIILLEYLKLSVDLFNPLLIILGLVCLVGFFTITVLELKRKNNCSENKTESVSKLFLPYGLFGVLLCLILIVSSLFVG
jgi:membrane protease YdiL (CAAX protease family)